MLSVFSTFAESNIGEVNKVMPNNIEMLDLGGGPSPSGGWEAKKDVVTKFNSLNKIDAAIKYNQSIVDFSAWNIFSVIAFVYLYKIGGSPRTFTPLAFMGNFYLFVFKFKMHEPKEEDEEISFKSGVFVCILDVIIILLLFITIIVLKKS